MGTIMHDGILYSGGGGSEAIELTQAQYDALPNADKHDLNKVYYITDGQGGGGYTLPIASASTLGGIKVGSGLSIDNLGVLSSSGFSLEPLELTKDVLTITFSVGNISAEDFLYTVKTYDELKEDYSAILFQVSEPTKTSGFNNNINNEYFSNLLVLDRELAYSYNYYLFHDRRVEVSYQGMDDGQKKLYSNVISMVTNLRISVPDRDNTVLRLELLIDSWHNVETHYIKDESNIELLYRLPYIENTYTLDELKSSVHMYGIPK